MKTDGDRARTAANPFGYRGRVPSWGGALKRAEEEDVTGNSSGFHVCLFEFELHVDHDFGRARRAGGRGVHSSNERKNERKKEK